MATTDTDTNDVKSHILDTYINGAFNKRDVVSMRKGFHDDFAIFSADGEALAKFTIDEWTAGLEKSIREGYDAGDPKNSWAHKFVSVDVTGGSAAAKIELYNEGVHIYTDYLSLLKFDSGWRISAKVYHQHNERKNW